MCMYVLGQKKNHKTINKILKLFNFLVPMEDIQFRWKTSVVYGICRQEVDVVLHGSSRDEKIYFKFEVCDDAEV